MMFHATMNRPAVLLWAVLFASVLPVMAHADPAPAEFCDTIVKIQSTLSSSIPLQAMGPKAARATADKQLAVVGPLYEAARKSAPGEIASAVQTIAAVTGKSLSALDFAATQTADYAAADHAVDGIMKADCGFHALDVTASDYEYQNVPEEVPQGKTAVTLANKGDEVHELSVARINDNVKLSAREVLSLPIKESLASVALLGYVTAAPGSSETTFVNLSPGRYYIVCFVPRGTSSFHSRGKGTPHVMLGMLKEFVVK